NSYQAGSLLFSAPPTIFPASNRQKLQCSCRTGPALRAQIKLGRIAGITIGLHYSWFIIAVLITITVADHFHLVMPGWSPVALWSVAVITGLLFFAALLLHELAHSLLAKARGLRVRGITLFALGGVSQIESEAPDPKSEFSIAIAGPIASIAIGLVLLGTAWLGGWLPGTEPTTPVISVLVWLGRNQGKHQNDIPFSPWRRWATTLLGSAMSILMAIESSPGILFLT